MTDTNPDIDHAAIERHYAHACEKHPHFCDALADKLWIDQAGGNLEVHRLILNHEVRHNRTEATQILQTEIAEIIDSYARKDYPAAVEECHDAIAVLLRMAKMIADEGEAAKDAQKEGEVAK